MIFITVPSEIANADVSMEILNSKMEITDEENYGIYRNYLLYLRKH